MIFFHGISLMFMIKLFELVSDTEADKGFRRRLKEAIHAALFGMNAPAVCAVSQVLFLCSYHEIQNKVIVYDP